MKYIYTLIIAILLWIPIYSQNDFNNFFKNKSLRVDLQLGGDSNRTDVFLSQIKKEKYYAGPHKNLIDKFNYGAYRYSLYDGKTGRLLFSKGFCSLFNEWISTDEATKIKRVFYHTTMMPYPNKTVLYVLEERKYETGKFERIFEYIIDPRNYFIIDEESSKYKIEKIIDNGNNTNSLDIAFIAEGYTQNEMPKFILDVKRMVNQLFSVSPYKRYKKNINIYAIQSSSIDSGTDIPSKGIYKNTVVNSTFSTFDVERYLTTVDIKSISDISASVPHDAVCVLVNTEKYGGGGFYNFYGLVSADHTLSEKVMVHEFGHSFAGLADEYYTSSVATEDYYNVKTEPWEPNITTNIDFKSKWKKMINITTPVPTPRKFKYSNNVGMFEGGGYMSKGIYSPAMDCIMKSNTLNHFCPVCEKAIQNMIEFYMDK